MCHKIQTSNLRAMAYHTRNGKPFAGLNQDELDRQLVYAADEIDRCHDKIKIAEAELAEAKKALTAIRKRAQAKLYDDSTEQTSILGLIDALKEIELLTDI